MYTILIPIWKRPTLTDRVINYYKKRQERFGFRLVVVGSEEPDYGSTMGVEYVHSENKPVSQKLTNGAKQCNFKDSTGIFMLGSDDYVNDELLEYIGTIDGSSTTCIQWKEVYMYRCKDQKLSLWESGKMGAGRFLTKVALNLVDYKLFNQGDHRNKALDYGIWERFIGCGADWETKSLKDIGGCIVDVKYSDNLSPHAIVDAGEERLIQELPEYIQSELLILNEKFKEEQIKPRIRTKIPEGMARIVATANPNHQMKPGEVYEVSANTAMVLIEKGFAYLEGQEPKKEKPKEEKKLAPKRKRTRNAKKTSE